MKKVKESEDFKIYNQTYAKLIKSKIKSGNLTFANETEKIKSILEYYKSSVGLIEMLRKIIVDIRYRMREIIRREIYSVDKEFAFGICILVSLFLISPMIVVLIRNAVNALQIFASSLKGKVRDLKRDLLS